MNSIIYSYKWLSKDRSIICHGFNEDNEPCVIKVVNFFPFLFVVSKKIENILYSLSSYIESFNTRTMTFLNNNVLRRDVHILYFRRWSEREKSIHIIKKSGLGTLFSEDIDHVTMFLTCFNIRYTGWLFFPTFAAEDKYTISYQICYSPTEIVKVDRGFIPDPLILVFDIECYSSNHRSMPKSYRATDKIVMISFVLGRLSSGISDRLILVNSEFLPTNYKPDINCKIASDEVDLISLFVRLIKFYNPDIITGYNIFGFDIPYIEDRASLFLTYFPKASRRRIEDDSLVDDSTVIKQVEWQSASYGINIMRKLSIDGRIVMDVFQNFKRMKKTESFRLSEVSEKFLQDKKIDLPAHLMFDMLSQKSSDNINKIIEYCIKDSELVFRLIKKLDMWTTWLEESGVTMVSIEDLYTRGNGIRITNLLFRECYERSVAMVKSIQYKYDFQGAVVFEPPVGLFENCTCVDFRSLYPSIMIQFNICRSTYIGTKRSWYHDYYEFCVNGKIRRYRSEPQGVIPRMLMNLLKSREKVKDEMNSLGGAKANPILNERQNALKICANSVYGVLGSQESKYVSHYESGEIVTYIGRMFVTWLRNFIATKYGLSVPYGDTDSSYIYGGPNISKERLIEITKKIVDDANTYLPQHVKLAYEAHYDGIVFLTKKKYILISNGEIQGKGILLARRGSCSYAKKLYKSFIKLVLVERADKDKVFDFVRNEYMKLLMGHVDIEELLISKSYNGSYKSSSLPQKIMVDRLKSIGINISPGSRIEYIFVRIYGENENSDNYKLQGQKMYTIDEVKDLSLAIDFLYYLKKQVLNEIERLAKISGYEKAVSRALCFSVNEYCKKQRSLTYSIINYSNELLLTIR